MQEISVLKIATCITQEHDLRLVALSALICVLGCITTTTILAHVQLSNKRTTTRWLVMAAVLFGFSVWSLHFVAMLAFLPSHSIGYDPVETVGSVAVAIVGASGALFILRSRQRTPTRVLLSGIMLGAGVAGMHYLGVDAMRFTGMMLFDRTYVSASVVASLVFATIAMARSDNLVSIWRRLEVASWLSITICGLHFTGMTALTMVPGGPEAQQGLLLGSQGLAYIVGSVSLVILAVSLAAALLDQHLLQRELQELHRMRLMSNLSREVLIIQRNGIVLEMNRAGERLFGMQVADAVGRDLLDLFAEDSAPALIRRSTCKFGDLKPEEMVVRTLTGAQVAVELSCQAIEFLGKPARAVALRDLTDARRDEARIRHLARHDALTNLPNRYQLEEKLTHALDVASEAGTAVAVLYLDLDRFKPVNDLYGHAAGDQLLVQASKRLLGEIHASDTLARIGGDEFVLVLTSVTSPEKVATLADRLIETLKRPFTIEDHELEISASIGVAIYPGDGGNPETLMRAADTAMYRVKDEGRGAPRFYEASMQDQLQARRLLEHELGCASDRDEFLLFYQPIINSRSGEIATFEALIRWAHPKRGMVPPIDFIPVAEQTGLIAPIGQWVLETACAEAATWPEPWRVSVNVSPSQFQLSDVPAMVSAALAKTKLDSNRLVIEITEGVFIDNAARAVEVLEKLRNLGVRLALDDFGTGYSSLSYLQLFKFDKFKVDKSFVTKLGTSDEAATIIKTIINLGHNLGLNVTVEGVETVQQMKILKNLGCDQMQGYLFGKPAPMDKFSAVQGTLRARALSLSGDQNPQNSETVTGSYALRLEAS